MPTLLDKFRGNRLELPVLINYQYQQPSQAVQDCIVNRKGRGEDPVVEVVPSCRDQGGKAESAKCESKHRPVNVIAGGLHHLMSHIEQVDHGQGQVGQSQCGCYTKVFAQYEQGAGDRFAHDRQGRTTLDFSVQYARCREGGQQQSSQKQRAEAQVDHQFVVIFEGVGRQWRIEPQANRAADHQNHEHGLADRLDESIKTQCGKLAKHMDDFSLHSRVRT